VRGRVTGVPWHAVFVVTGEPLKDGWASCQDLSDKAGGASVIINGKIRMTVPVDNDLVIISPQRATKAGFFPILQISHGEPWLPSTPLNMPPVIFVTAHDQYAIRAFEIAALDYLLKPVTEQRFGVAFKRALNRLRAPYTRTPRDQC
jgi:hypothetical protein